MRDSRFYKPGLGALAVLLLYFCSAVQTAMNKDREDMQLTRVTPLENAPPALVFTTVALGGFRGLISNVLWIRANQMQQESKYFEMVQLADWITKLQPHYPQVWRIQAWNMTYNISVKFPNRDDKWNWVLAGFELLRDEGIKYNPHEAVLYEEMCYFLYHKMGGTSDLAHQNFKIRWAWEWHNLLNSNHLQLFADATVEDLPKTGENLAVVARTSRGLHFRAFDAEGEMILDAHESTLVDLSNDLPTLRTQLDELWNAPEIPLEKRSSVLETLASLTRLPFLNGTGFPDYPNLVNPQTETAITMEKKIREKHKMDVFLMKEVDEKYGPLDWRLPETHAIYWAMEGLRKAKTDKLLPLRRIIYQSMQMASRRGKVIENLPMKKLEYSANIKIIPKANAAYLEMMEIDPSRIEHISQGHRNFLIRAIRDLYFANQRSSALEWFTYAKEVYPDLWYDDADIDKFVIQNVVEDLDAMNPNDFRLMIEGYISRAYYNLARGETELYQGYIGTARKVREKFMYWILKPGVKRIETRSLPSMEELETGVLKTLFDPATGTPPELIAVWETLIPDLDKRLGRDKDREETPDLEATDPGAASPTANPDAANATAR